MNSAPLVRLTGLPYYIYSVAGAGGPPAGNGKIMTVNRKMLNYTINALTPDTDTAAT